MQLIIEIWLPLDVEIFDAIGKQVRTIFKGKAEMRNILIWDGTNDSGVKMAKGSYYIKANNQIKKLILN